MDIFCAFFEDGLEGRNCVEFLKEKRTVNPFFFFCSLLQKKKLTIFLNPRNFE
jgi:hypothetical protein